MRRVWNVHPDQGAVRREVKSLCKRLGLAGPVVKFWNHRADGMYYEATKTVYLPDPAWMLEVQPDLTPQTYWLLAFHETAHYVSCANDDVHVNHCPEMYATLIGIVLMLGLPLDTMHMDEDAYLPRAFKRGRQHAGRLLLRGLTAMERK